MTRENEITVRKTVGLRSMGAFAYNDFDRKRRREKVRFPRKMVRKLTDVRERERETETTCNFIGK